MPYAKHDVERTIEFWKLAMKSEHGLAIMVDIDRRHFRNLLDEGRRLYLNTEEAYALTINIPEQPEDEVWIVRKYNEGDSTERRLPK